MKVQRTLKSIRHADIERLMLTATLMFISAVSEGVSASDDLSSASRPSIESSSVISSCDLATYGVAEPKMTPPVIHVKEFGAKGDGVTDDSAAINRAIQSMARGGTLVFEPGRTYLKRKTIIVNKPDVKLWGYKATILAYVTPEEFSDHPRYHKTRDLEVSIQLRAPRTSIYGFTILSNMRKRTVGTPGTVAVYLTSDDHEVIDNRFEYTQNGVRVRGVKMAKNFLIARNVVYRTTADGIAMMTNSWGGRVLCNIVRETGDDMISVLNYGLGEPNNVGNILIAGNDVSSQYWGRGITVHGGRNVTIRNNRIAETTHGAGILIRGGADTYQMANVRHVRVENNEIMDVQTTDPVYNPLTKWKRTGQAAIDIRGYGEVSDVLVKGNVIARTRNDGILVKGNARGIGLEGNKISNVRGNSIKIESRSDAVACADNSYEGADIKHPRCQGDIPVVAGAEM